MSSLVSSFRLSQAANKKGFDTEHGRNQHKPLPPFITIGERALFLDLLAVTMSSRYVQMSRGTQSVSSCQDNRHDPEGSYLDGSSLVTRLSKVEAL